MVEWLSGTVSRIGSFEPERVLEIGCGVGLLLQHLAPGCAVYCGTDITASAIGGLRRWLEGKPEFGHVELKRGEALDLEGLESGSYDTVVLNSVVQYFPDLAYLRAVLAKAVELVT